MNFLPKQPQIISEKENWARFEIESLYPGYGVTIGNSLRRVLLSSLSGAAVTQVKIKGVQHEFSTIKGVSEDVVVIMMNLKQLRFKMYSDEPQKAVLKLKGEKEIKGSDFELPTQLELINKDCHIATLTDKKIELEMEIQVEKGVGYDPVEQRKVKEKLEIGVIPIDAIFTPIKRVSFKVENMRVGEKTNFDRVILDVETDGTITPKDAFYNASEILVNHFSLLRDAFKKSEEKETVSSKKADNDKNDKKENKEEDPLKTKIEDLKLSNRVIKSLLDNSVKTVGGILKKNEKSILDLEGMGEAGLKEIKKALKKLGLELKSE